ncbi:non-ribosomal peptide synthetase, partial [Streptomyces sp. 150FB]|uniref:non-ribosomal peptide synthetase n=1 Tax=Streptomyces sp. 150FB TaxID=1576605 RepID=UPI001364D547
LAGAGYVALDPAHPPARTRQVLADSGAVLLLTDRPWTDTFDSGGLPTTVLADDAGLIAAQYPTPPESAARADTAGVAYLAYTSGSTGRPKGVRTPHHAAAAYLRDYLGGFGLGPRDTVLQLASLPFDASVRDLIGPLTTGARVVLVRDDEAADPEALVAAIDKHGVTCLLSVVPTLLRALLTVAERAPGHGPKLRLLLTAGEALDLADCARATAAFAGRPGVVNQYGPTEATMTTTSAAVTAKPGDTGPAPLGAPVAGARLWIVDRFGDLAPVGVPGEIWIGGARLADGYHGQPGLTAGQFVPEPFSGLPGARAYRTGDLARREEDGTLTFLGRGDDQVKIRGQRVEPAGVESVLRTLPGVEEAAVIAVRQGGPTGQLRLLACVAPAGLDPAEVRAGLRGLLPDHQVPADIRVLPALPRTANNKLDRRTLAALGEAAIGAHAAPADPPRTATERAVAAVFTEVLDAERVGARPIGRDDDFFERGGHSLLAAQLAARLNRSTGRTVPLREIMDLRTVAALAARLDADAPPVDTRAEGKPRTDREPRDPRPVTTGPRPLTPGEAATWWHSRREPDTAAYHIGFQARVGGPLDEIALVRALDALVTRHEALRTRFPATGAGPVRTVDPLALLPLARADTRADADPPGAALALALTDLRAPFDLGRAPLARATVIRCGDEEYVLGLTVHHIVSDGWTLSVLERDLTTLYNELAAGRLPALEPAAGFTRWVPAEPVELDSPGQAAGAAFWADRLRGIPAVLPLPTDLPRPASWSTAGALELFDLAPEVASGVRRLAGETGATDFMVLLAAVQRWLGELSGARRFLVAVPVSNRPDPDSENTAGPFANIVPVPADLRGEPSFSELVGRVKETFLDVWEHRAVPFELLADRYAADDGSRPPLCQAMFAVQNVPAAGRSLSGLTTTPLTPDRGTCRYELHLRCYDTPDGGLSGWLEYSTSLFEPDALRRRLDGFLTVLRDAVEQPEARRPDRPDRPDPLDRPDRPDRLDPPLGEQ